MPAVAASPVYLLLQRCNGQLDGDACDL